MPKYQKTARLSRWVTRFFMLVLLAALFTMPRFTQWYVSFRVMTEQAGFVLLAAFYVCAVPSALALWQIDRLLGSICAGRVFLEENSRRVSRVSLCCAAVCLVTAAAGFVYPPLFFIAVVMLFLCLLVNVVASVLAAATELREENDLTI